MAHDFSPLKKNINETKEWLLREMSGIRTGRASVALLDNIKPEVYGSRVPISQVASMSGEDARTIRIVPWDKSTMKAIEKAITEADLGVSAVTDDMGMRVVFPELTAERRIQLMKLANEKVETAKIALRGHRTEAIKVLDAQEKEGGMGKDEHKRLKDEVQKLIDTGNEELEATLKKKEEEIAL